MSVERGGVLACLRDKKGTQGLVSMLTPNLDACYLAAKSGTMSYTDTCCSRCGHGEKELCVTANSS